MYTHDSTQISHYDLKSTFEAAEGQSPLFLRCFVGIILADQWASHLAATCSWSDAASG